MVQKAKKQINANTAKTEKEILANLEIQAQKLVFLLVNSKLPKEVKEAWVTLLPAMSLKQMDRLRNILEARFLNIQTSNIDEEYNQKLEKLKRKFHQKQEENNKIFLKQLKELEKIIEK
jgi:transcriptional regulator of heat shock response